jgi:hypothetical protein
MCFSLDVYSDLEIPAMDFPSPLLELPFQMTWLEMKSHDSKLTSSGCFFSSDQNKPGCFRGFIFLFPVNSVPLCIGDFLVTEDKEILFDKANGLDKSIHIYLTVLCWINLPNIKKVQIKPTHQERRVAKKLGHKPLFSYWILEIDTIKSRELGVDNGGTHSSPRVHLRRGHTRQYAPGKWCWVQPCTVGNKELGMVHKDYAIKTTVH